ncbi:MAG: GxxExxY protein [Spartobacteria bacterium]|nr:GxxExxY protein [Spartobacteria bacterium]
MDLNELTEKVIGLAIKVHRILGPGLLESAYEQALMIEFRRNGIQAQNQVLVPIVYEGEIVEKAFRADIVVEDQLILELKSVKTIDPSVYKTLFTYLRLSHLKAGLIFNFHERLLKDGIKRMVV